MKRNISKMINLMVISVTIGVLFGISCAIAMMIPSLTTPTTTTSKTLRSMNVPLQPSYHRMQGHQRQTNHRRHLGFYRSRPFLVSVTDTDGYGDGVVTSLDSQPPLPTVQDTLILNELCNTPGIPLSQFMNEVVILYPHLNELTLLFRTIPTACRIIAQQLQQPSPIPDDEATLPRNHHVLASDVMKRTIRQTNLRIGILTTAAITTADTDEVPDLDDPESRRIPATVRDEEIVIAEGIQYLTIIHPLLEGDGDDDHEIDDTSIPRGTVFGIYERDAATCSIDPTNGMRPYNDDRNDETTDTDECLANTLQPGTNLVAAAYCYYSVFGTYFVLSIRQSGVYVFRYHDTIGEFILTKANIQIPSTSHIYRTNPNFSNVIGNDDTEDKDIYWEEPIRQMMAKWSNGNGLTKTKFRRRYMGNIIADLHSIITNGYGGVYYHGGSGIGGDDISSSNSSNHQLQTGIPLLYVAAPMSYIIEQAGGMSYTIVHGSNETYMLQRVLEISPNVVHECIPIILGSKIHVEEMIDAYNHNDSNNSNR